MASNQVFDALGFYWQETCVPDTAPIHSVERAIFRFYKALPEFVWDASMLEGNPFTFPEVQTILDGVTVGGHRISDERQVVNLAESAKELRHLVRSGSFTLSKETSDHLHSIVAHDEAFDAGFFRGEGLEKNLTPSVSLGQYGNYRPLDTQPGGENLRSLYDNGLQAIKELATPFLQGLTYFLFAALHKFYFDGNKRTARYMMNGHLMSNGVDAISIPAARSGEFNAYMVDFYRTKDATTMLAFLVDCHPDADQFISQETRSLLSRK